MSNRISSKNLVIDITQLLLVMDNFVITIDGFIFKIVTIINNHRRAIFNPWTSLSTAQKITAGLYCIKTFCKHYNVYMPIWIDNSESIVFIPAMDSQVICMYVSEKDKKLRVVHG